MTLDDIYRVVQYLGAKDINGEPFTIVQLNRLLPVVVYEMVSDEMTALLANKAGSGDTEIDATSLLNPFKTTGTLATTTAGIAPIPTDYVRYLSFRIPGSFRDITPVSDQEYNRIQGGMLNRRVDVRPIVRPEGTNFKFCPFDIGNVQMVYIRKPVTPYYDYCQDANLNPVFMPATSYLVPLGTVDTYQLVYDDPVTSMSTILNSLVTKSGADWSSSPSYTSLTKELEFEGYVHIRVVSRLLLKCGLNLSEPEIEKAALQMQQMGH